MQSALAYNANPTVTTLSPTPVTKLPGPKRICLLTPAISTTSSYSHRVAVLLRSLLRLPQPPSTGRALGRGNVLRRWRCRHHPRTQCPPTVSRGSPLFRTVTRLLLHPYTLSLPSCALPKFAPHDALFLILFMSPSVCPSASTLTLINRLAAAQDGPVDWAGKRLASDEWVWHTVPPGTHQLWPDIQETRW